MLKSPRVLLIPITACPEAEVDAVAALKLFSVVVLPIRLSDSVPLPFAVCIPVSEALTLVVVPFVVMEPIALLEIERSQIPSVAMPKAVPPLPDVVTTMESVPLL